ncbi:glycosyltransferase family 4 protein [Phyllobacterium sp. SB3]|uniref:glycosyltransferase n=1 Tax=Phyllobacterium sp. SB3 TaxID=3156073 RepID=UPI0032AFA3C5
MHIVFVTSIVPDGKPATGYEIANKAIIDGLRRAGVKVTVIGFVWPGSAPLDPENTILLGEVDVRNDTASFSQKLRWLGKAVLAGLTVSSVKLRIITKEKFKEALASAEPFDAYVLNGVALAGAFEDCFTGKPQIFIAHNVEHRSARENADAATSIVQKYLFSRESRLLAGLEKRLCDSASFVFTLADEDITALQLETTGRATALPLVTEADTTKMSDRKIERDLGLIGTWTWQPNRIGLEWFLREVAPHLDKDIGITVAGSTPADLKAAWPKVNFAGRVPDATDFVRSCAVIPLISRAGTGVQLKTIETFELGLPSVATALSVRGIADVPDNCVVADDPVAFAKAVNQMVDRVRGGEDMTRSGEAFRAAQRARFDRQIKLGLDRVQTGK